MTDRIRIATRKSKLALWQARHLKQRLEETHAGLAVEIVGMVTEGDRNKRSPLGEIGGKGVFVKQLEQGLLEGDVEVAMHCMKDVPGVLPDGLQITTMLPREDPRDALVSLEYSSLRDLPVGARVGSSSLRRKLQLKHIRPDLNYQELRGNVDTRLKKLADGEYDGIIAATAGLIRLGLKERISEIIATNISIPSAGQGALGIETRIGDDGVNRLLADLNHPDTLDCVTCEREISIGLEASCNLPIAAFASLSGDDMTLMSYISDLSGKQFIKLTQTSHRDRALQMAAAMVVELQNKGASKLMASHS